MGNENDVGFKVIANIEGLKESMGQAANSVKGFAENASKSVEGIGGAFEGLSKAFLGFAAVLAGGAIFHEAIEATVEWTTEVRNLAKNFGITTEEASGLALALDAIEVSTDDYRGAAAKLDRQIKSNEDQVNALGVVTRDQNGNLLSQQQLMLNAISTLNQYKEGTDRNVAAMFLFGRGAGEMANLLRLTKEELKEGADDAERFGLVVSEQAANDVLRYKKAINDVGDSFTGVQRVIGTALIPLLTSLAENFSSNSKALQVVEFMVKSLETAFVGLQTIVYGITNAIGEYFAEMVIKFQTYTEQIAAYATLNFTKANEAAKNGQALLEATMKEGAEKMARDMEAQKALIAQIWNIGGINDAPKNAPKEAAGTKTVPKGFGDTNAAKEAAKQQQQIAQQNATTQIQLDKMVFENKKGLLDAELSVGLITKQQQLTQLRDLANQEYQLDQETLLKYKQNKNLTVVETNKVNNQLKLLEQKHANDIQQINRQSVLAQMADFQKLFSTIKSSFSGAIQGILMGTQTWQQAMQNIFSNILSSFIGMLAEMVLNWIEKQVLMALFGEAIAGASDRTTIAGHAATAGAGAYAATAVIPVIGPILAPGAAAMAYAGAMAYQLMVPAAKQGFDIPKGVNPLTQLHEEEMVLPAPLANAVRDMAGGGSGGGATVNINLSAIDTRSGADFLKAHASTIAKAINGQMRNANPALAGMKG